MSIPRPAGRPKAISRDMLEEAACELFLERGYARTSVEDITRRAGVSRATFFNYVGSKADLLWAAVDDAIAEVAAALGRHEPRGSDLVGRGGAGTGTEGEALPADVTRAGFALIEGGSYLEPGVAVLAIVNAEAMGVGPELELSGAERQARLARVLADYFRASEASALAADVAARALAGAFFAALETWAHGDPGADPFPRVLTSALGALEGAFAPLAEQPVARADLYRE